MKASRISIKNFRSIEDVQLDISDEKQFHTYGLIGVNEAGKSSILNALRVFQDLITPTSKDFRDPEKPIEIEVQYRLSKPEWDEIQKNNLVITTKIDESKWSLFVKYENSIKGERTWGTYVYDPETDQFTAIPNEAVNDDVIFWTAEERFLISKPIDLIAFSASPDSVSIPLKNCFHIAGIENIKERVTSSLKESTDIEELEELLGDEVTKHLNKTWPNHPVKITFKINGSAINFHIKDLNVRAKAKTIEQRSDGFKQFLSFLLTISAESVRESLENTIIVIDEPETHLHPQAQIFFLEELKRISKSKQNTVIFSTHSNYMIDRENIDHYFRVVKINDKTQIEPINKAQSSYSSVNFHVFDIESNDYFIELYTKLHEVYIDGVASEDERKKRESQTSFNENYLHSICGLKKIKPYKGNANSATLPCYIRNCINHPESGSVFTREELRKSINDLIEFLDKESSK